MRCPTLSELPTPPPEKKGWPWTEETSQLPDTMLGGQPWPKVSIVTPSYNQGEFIEETIRSVLLQGYTNLEYIIIDGGSTDNSVEIIKKYQKWLAYWVSEPDRGQSHAINKGFEKATGEIYAWLNSDDTYMPSAGETAVKYLTEHSDVDMIYGECNFINEHSHKTGQYPPAEFNLVDLVCGRNMVPQQAVFFRKQILDNVGYLDTNLQLAMDYDFWLRVALRAKIVYVPQVLANYRLCAGTKTREQAEKWSSDLIYSLDKLFSIPTLTKEIRRQRCRAYGNVYLTFAFKYHSLGQMRESRKHFIEALKVYPQSFLSNLRPSFYLASTFLGLKGSKIMFKWAQRLTNKG
jgi:glycosyltransferase involved in cell wall biosynthesis